MRALLLPACFMTVAGCASPSAPLAELDLASPKPSSPLMVAGMNVCPANTEILYSCSNGAAFESMCLGERKISYRYGNPRHVGGVVSTSDWSNIHIGDVRGGGGGYQTHVRFTRADGHNFIVLKGAPGQYHDAANGPWSGVTTFSPDGKEISRRCTGEAFVAPDWEGKNCQSGPG